MRDLETVETALLAAETGHLVFSTLHTPRRDRDGQPDHHGVSAASAAAGPAPARIGAEGRDRTAAAPARRPAWAAAPAVEVMVSTAYIRDATRRQGQDLADSRRDRRRHLPIRDADLRSSIFGLYQQA
jgi:twitching motility protein PilT